MPFSMRSQMWLMRVKVSEICSWAGTQMQKTEMLMKRTTAQHPHLRRNLVRRDWMSREQRLTMIWMRQCSWKHQRMTIVKKNQKEGAMYSLRNLCGGIHQW